MKNLFAVLCFVALAVSAQAQIKTPAPSPSATIMQTVGLTDVTVEYSRPSAKGRTIFGADALVPNGKIWRTGANSVTQVTFSNDVMIEGKELAAGKYGILTLPGASNWAVHFYTFESSSFNSYTEATPALAVSVMSKKSADSKESFTISIDDLKSDGATMNLAWANTVVPVKISTHSHKSVMESIEKVMAGPSTGDYYNAASYYYEADNDLDQALVWMNLATAGPDKKFWQMKKKSELLAKMGKKEEALAAANTSLELATKAGNNDYIKMNNDNIKMWSK
ncbi:MAG: hypothetical protein ACJA1A_000307 [Saprospiraceae bacterium]|jgi:hypothetical protein